MLMQIEEDPALYAVPWNGLWAAIRSLPNQNPLSADGHSPAKIRVKAEDFAKWAIDPKNLVLQLYQASRDCAEDLPRFKLGSRSMTW